MLLAFLAFVVLLAGFIAYAADNIARRAGRRHLRLFGLRPKTTALIVAVAAGMGISLASMLAFFALNRQAIRNIEQADMLRLELKSLRQDVVTVQSDLKSARSERDTANLRADEARQASVSALGQLGRAQSDLKSARAATDQLKTQAQTLQTRVSNLSALRVTLETQATNNRRALALSQTGLSAAQKELTLASRRASGLDSRLLAVQRQITLLDSQNAQAQVRVIQAQAQAQTAQAQTRKAQVLAVQAREQVNGLQAQIQQLDASRQAVTAQRDGVTVERNRAAAQLNQLQTQFVQAQARATQAATQAIQATAQAAQASAQARQAQAQLSSLTAQRDAVRSDLSALKATVAGLQAQALALKNDNDTLRLSLISSQADVKHLEDEYSRATTELSASRNTVLSYSKNSIVYGGVVASVRSLDGFLQAASTAAALRGARGTPSVRLAQTSRQALETTLRGLNASTFVLCRASGNAAAGFTVDLSCDARPNTLIYSHGSVIRKATVTLQGDDELLRGQLQDLVGDAVLDLTRRGVPLEYVLNGGLNTASLYSLLTRLAARGGGSAVVGVMPRGDVKPGSQVDLYADIVP